MIIWDEKKNEKLQKERGVSFEEVAKIIRSERHLAIIDHPTREEQRLCIVLLNGYVHAVPFMYDDKQNIILKTIFPCRKYHKTYGRQQHKTRPGGTMD